MTTETKDGENIEQAAAAYAGEHLILAARGSRRGAVAAALAFLDQDGAGLPDVPLFDEKVRAEASLWSSLATQHELEAYVVAGIMELESAPMTSKALKRLAAFTFRRMSAQDRAAFLGWADKQVGEKEATQ